MCYLFSGDMAKERRAQVAMEYLVTYGWALIIILAVIVALYAYGPFRPEFYVTERCDMAPGMSCTAFSLAYTEDGQQINFKLNLNNVMGYKIKANEVNITATNLFGPGQVTKTVQVIQKEGGVVNGDSLRVEYLISPSTQGITPSRNNMYSIKIEMNYTNVDVTPSTTHRTAGVLNVRLA
jgi:hypothetical protein